MNDFILKRNGYFSTGFSNAYKDETTSTVFARSDKGLSPVFPDDRLGNYFYLRNETTLNFTAKAGVEDCGINRVSFDDRINCFLVAIVDDADEFELINNLRNTLLQFKTLSCIPTAAIWQRENVTINEMQGFDDSEILKALENIKPGIQIVRIQFQVNKEYIPNKCVNNPCKNC